MMKRAQNGHAQGILAVAALALLLLPGPAPAASDLPHNFDAGGEKIFRSFNATPDEYLAADSGNRNLARFYELRQYPGSPPRIPHSVAPAFAEQRENCLACHGKGGYTSEYDRFAPVTPHPENESCLQCHLPRIEERLWVESNWQSIAPPKLGRSFMGGSPPPIPHSLQLRENCLACHTGPGAVGEIRVEHSSRGNCRQCHLPVLSSEPLLDFLRAKE